ncbi:unnamed protein product [Eruca vesicaria subsp. sativa]|uniref:Uncharacterized protein n=1 Tax=Eruca vesicaria subsp. sativa TaxID=29727 RepID=A0ABC8K427_ERUVS|nr:unnamed protein product [Eruca vesicaria subsp. sativa]
MKSLILFIVSCVVLLLVLSYPEVEAKAASNRCYVRDFFPGKCGNDGIQSCLRDFKKKTKKSHIVDQCKCDNVGQRANSRASWIGYEDPMYSLFVAHVILDVTHSVVLSVKKRTVNENGANGSC